MTQAMNVAPRSSSQCAECRLTKCLSSTKTAVPIIGPTSVPMPPRTTMTMPSPESIQNSTAGDTKPLCMANRAPAIAPRHPAITKESSLYRAVA